MLEPLEDGESESGEALEAGESSAPAEERAEAAETPESVEVLEDDWGGQSTGPAESSWSGDDLDRIQEFADASGQSLQEYLLWQLELAKLEPRELAIARAIVDAISDDGYVTESMEEIAETLKPDVQCTASEVASVLGGVQALDPPGVGARSIGECIEL
ncbi:RNA polymerase sigma factor 54, core-binding domain protein, partial [mine drainage metagenome]